MIIYRATVCCLLLTAIMFTGACGDSDETASIIAETATTTSQASTTITPATTESPEGQMYRNERYGYEVRLPDGWRVARQYMDKYAETETRLGDALSTQEHVVLTSLSPEVESAFIHKVESNETPRLSAIAPWLEFELFPTVLILPSDATPDVISTSVVEGDVVRENSDIRELSLPSGKQATRFTRRESDNRGEFIFDVVFIPGDLAHCSECTGVILRTVKRGETSFDDPNSPTPPTEAYPAEQFEFIFRSFRYGS